VKSRSIKIDVSFGDKVLVITLMEIIGTGSILWSVLINNMPYGSIRYRNQEWDIKFRTDSIFSDEDGQTMIEMVSALYDV
jgi:hypothetical protein